MKREILEDWEEPFIRGMMWRCERDNFVLDPNVWKKRHFCDGDINLYRGIFYRRTGGYYLGAHNIHEDYLREYNRRKEEFDKWLELEMNRNRDRDGIDCVQTETFRITLPRKTWRRIRELAKKYGMNVKLFISILVEATANRLADLEYQLSFRKSIYLNLCEELQNNNCFYSRLSRYNNQTIHS